jgi:glyoxylase-like metal-dependent hydrolase (beta-lactamase superfamily II)
MATPGADIVRISLPTPFPVGAANVFLLKGDPPILVDTGPKTEQGYEKLAAGLQAHGLRPADVGMVLLTHGHLDHAGLLARIVEASGAEVYAHPYVVEQYGAYDKQMEDNLRFLGDIMRQSGIPRDFIQRVSAERAGYRALAEPVTIRHALADAEVVAGFTAYYVPGHSAADILYFDPLRRLAFTGDHVLRDISPNPLIRTPRPGQPRAKSLVEYQQSLHRTRALDIETCYPGHGGPFWDHRRIIDNLLERQERRTAEVCELLAQGPLTPYELVTILFPKISMRMLHLGLSAAIGHLEVLEERGEVVRKERDGVAYYSLSDSWR